MKSCGQCGKNLLTKLDEDIHQCPPKYECWDDHDDPDCPQVIATWSGPEDAATEYADGQCTADGPYDGTVFVRDADGNVTQWEISHDFSINYYATEKQ